MGRGPHTHRSSNLANIFNPEACVSSVPKTTAQRLDNNWKAVLGPYDYTIRHIEGEWNCWGSLLSRWVNVPSVGMRSAAVFMASQLDISMPSKQVVREAQQVSRAASDNSSDSLSSFTSSIDRTVKDHERLYRVLVDDRHVLWFPMMRGSCNTAEVCAHIQEAGHRGSAATLQRLKE